MIVDVLMSMSMNVDGHAKSRTQMGCGINRVRHASCPTRNTQKCLPLGRRERQRGGEHGYLLSATKRCARHLRQGMPPPLISGHSVKTLFP